MSGSSLVSSGILGLPAYRTKTLTRQIGVSTYLAITGRLDLFALSLQGIRMEHEGSDAVRVGDGQAPEGIADPAHSCILPCRPASKVLHWPSLFWGTV
jgi:hypothetical protein